MIEEEADYGYIPEKTALHSQHIVHYWVGHKSGLFMKCACGAKKDNKTGNVTYDT